MRVVGFTFNKILVERKDNKVFEPGSKINQNIDIKDVVKEKNTVTNSETIKVSFGFFVEFAKDFARIDFEGNVILLPEKPDELDNFIKSWKSKTIPDSARAPLFNFIMNKCNVKALSLEDDFALPFHVPLPKLTHKEKDK